MLKTSESIEFTTQPGKARVEVDSDSSPKRDGRYKLDRSKIGGNKVDGGEGGDNKVEKKGQKIFKSKNLFKSKKTVKFSDFFTSGARLAFTKLTQAFVIASILQHFDSECHIWIEMDISGYIIGKVLNKLTSDNLGQ